MSRRLIPRTIFITLLLIGVSVSAQDSGDNLDFLDKVENIQVPVEKAPAKVESTKTESVEKKTTKSTQTTQPKTTKTTTKKTTVSPTTTTKKSTSVAPTTNLTSPSSTTPKSTITSPETKTSPKTSEIESTLEVTEGEEGIWVDEPLAMEPDYLPGFAVNATGKELPVEDKTEKTSETQVVHPLPSVTGDYSIFKSFTGFLSKYQKAFYIFGILLLFAIYRLRSGRVSSSSRRSTPTIRRMRR